MHFEGITLAGVIDELKDAIEGAFIQQIHQPSPEILTLELYSPAQKQKHKLLIVASGDARLHLTAQRFENPLTPSAFCMLLRKHLRGGVLEAIEQPDLERIADLIVKKRDERYVLRAELLGNRGNVVLLRGEEVLGALKSSVGSRVFRPHARYEPPPSQPKLDLRACSKREWLAALQAQAENPLKKAIAAITAGVGPRTAEELIVRAGLDLERSASSLAPEELEKLWEAAHGLFAQVACGRWEPRVYLDPEGKTPVDCTPFPYEMYAHLECQVYESLSEALDACHRGPQQEPVEALRRELKQALKDRLEKLNRALRGVEKDLQNAARHEEIQQCGDLLMAQLHRVEKGQTSVELEDLFQGGTRTIALDPTLTPIENAQRYYERAKKLRRALGKLTARRQELQLERQYLEELQLHLEQAETLDELKVLAEEMQAEGLLPKSKGAARMRPVSPSSSGPRRLELDGWIIFVGRSSRQNDRLIREAHPDDYWLHARERPGAHVIVKGPRKGERPPDPVLLRAAQLAAYYSRGRGSAKVPVIVTRVKHLRKPKGGKPGLVLVMREEETLIVAPKGDLE